MGLQFHGDDHDAELKPYLKTLLNVNDDAHRLVPPYLFSFTIIWNSGSYPLGRLSSPFPRNRPLALRRSQHPRGNLQPLPSRLPYLYSTRISSSLPVPL